MQNQFTHPWTKEEIDFIKNNIQKITYKQMSTIIHRTPSSIQSKVRYLPYQQKVKKHYVNSYFFAEHSAEMAYVLGFIAADGNICHSGKAHTLHIACDDKDIIEKIKRVLQYQGPIHQKLRFNGKISYSLRICDPIIFRHLQKLNITERKSLTLIPPKLPKILVRHFIRGYFDGDGSVSIRNIPYPSKLTASFYTASSSMANFLYKNIKSVLGTLYNGKIITKLTHQKTKFYHIYLRHNAATKLFTYMYVDSNLYMERKYKKFIEGMNV